MIRLLREWYEGAVQGARARRVEASLAEAVLSGLSLTGREYVDTDVPLGPTGGQLRRVVQRYPMQHGALEYAQQQAVRLYSQNGFARNLVRQIVNHTVGRGFAVRLETPEQDATWKATARAIEWPSRRREIVRRVFREGEAILRRFGPALVRFVEPEQLTPTPNAPLGVEFIVDDAEHPIAYWIDGQPVDAADVFHFKDPDCDASDPRGWPTLYDAQPAIEDYSNFIADRGMLNRFRSAVMMFKKYKGAAGTYMRQMQDAVRSGTLTRPGTTSQANLSVWRNIGRIIEHPEEVEYEFKNPNVGGVDASEDGRAIRLLIAVWYSMPEYLTTSDASNANFASTAVAESPGVKAMESIQEWFGECVSRFVSWAAGVDLGEVSVVFPAVVARKELEQTQARQIRYQNGVLSKQTWMELDGVDVRQETERLINPS